MPDPIHFRGVYDIECRIRLDNTVSRGALSVGGWAEQIELTMGRKGVGGRRRTKNNKQNPPGPANKAKALGFRGTKKRPKAEKSQSGPIEGFGKLMSEPGDLPDSYGKTRLDLLPVDPHLLHAYWEVAPAELDTAKDRLGDQYKRSQAVLRLYDVANNGLDIKGYFDVKIDLEAKNSYVDLESPDKSYFAELGFCTQGGRFYPVTRSVVAKTPPDRPAEKADEQYMLVRGDYDLLERVSPPQDTQSPFRTEEDPSKAQIHDGSSAQDSDFQDKRAGDLADISEKSFIAGISSKA